MNSFNHYAYGSIGAWLYADVAGIDADPDHPGFKHIILRPQPGGGLIFAKATYASVHGPIVSDWNIKEGTFDWQITIPPNTTATVYFPTMAARQIAEAGTVLEQAEGVEIVQQDAETIVCEIVSGSYHFVA